MKKAYVICSLLFYCLSINSNIAYAVGAKEAAASLILPTTGQAMNGELGSTKTKVMGGLEFGLVTTMAVIGVTAGGPAVWWAAAPLIGNHLWSATDAYKSAKKSQQNIMTQNLQLAQRNIDLTRENAYDREQEYRSDIRERVRLAGEQVR